MYSSSQHLSGRHFRSGVLTFALLAGILLVFSVSGAQARPEMAGQKTAEDRFSKMDADKDGKVSREEFFATHPQMKEGAFKAIDTNSDNVISLEEWKEFAAGHKSSESGSGMGGMGGMGGAAPKEQSANGTGGSSMPSLIMPHGDGK